MIRPISVDAVADDDAEEQDLPLPTLDLGDIDLDSPHCRRQALDRLDDLLDRLEMANLADLRYPPNPVVRDLVDLGLRNPLHYTISQLIEVVFNTQLPVMRANQDGYSRL